MTDIHYLSTYISLFFKDYLIQKRNLSRETIKSYRDAVKLFYGYADTHFNKSPLKIVIDDIKVSTVIDFLAYLEKERGNSINTRNHRLVAVRAIFRYIALQEPSLSDHCRRIMAIPSKRGSEIREISYLEKHEIDAIFKSVDVKSKLGRRDYTMLLFMYNTGARVQETADARLSWLSFTNPFKVEILGKRRKWRTCPLWNDTANILQRYITEQKIEQPPEDYLFRNRYGKPLSRFGILYIIDKYKNIASLHMPSLMKKHVTPHTIRHTTAMHLLQSGVELNVIRSWLGHADIATTNCYVEIDMAMKMKALQACEYKNESRKNQKWTSDPDTLAWLESL